METIWDSHLNEKLRILADAAKYDAACTSSGVDKKNGSMGTGNAVACGICHSFSADGRCISLLKILLTNDCCYDCVYCVNRVGNDTERATFSPDEVCTLTMGFYRRNYIEGLFLSSAVYRNPSYTMELIYETVLRLRTVYHFHGYIHVKAIPGADPQLIQQTAFEAYAADSTADYCFEARSGAVPACTALCAGRTEYPDDYRSNRGVGLSDYECIRGALWQI